MRIQFSILSKNSLYPCQKSKFSDASPKIFSQSFLFHFGRQSVYHDINKLADSQKNKDILDNGSIIAEFFRSVYQRTYLQAQVLRKQEILEKSQIVFRQVPVSSLPSRHIYLVISVKNYVKGDLKAS